MRTNSTEEILRTATSLGDAIQRIRRARNMSLLSLARQVGLTVSQVRLIESGTVRTDKIKEFSAALQTNMSSLMTLNPGLPDHIKLWVEANPELVHLLDDMHRSNRDLNELIESIRRLLWVGAK